MEGISIVASIVLSKPIFNETIFLPVEHIENFLPEQLSNLGLSFTLYAHPRLVM